MRRISSSASNCTKGDFCSAVFENLAGKVDLSLTYWGEKHYNEYNIKLVMCWMPRWNFVLDSCFSGSVPIYILYSNLCNSDIEFWLWTPVTSLFWAFGRVRAFFAITSSRVNPLCSFFNMMRISSSATSCTKKVYFRSAVFEKLASKISLDFRPRSGLHHPTPLLNLWTLLLRVTKLVFWIARLT